MTSIIQLLARPDRSTWLVSGYAFEDEPLIKLLAYRVYAPLDDAPARVSSGRAYAGPREASYRTSTGFERRLVWDPSKPADKIATLPLPAHFPGVRRKIEYRGCTFSAVGKNGDRKMLLSVTDEYVAGVIATAFPTIALHDPK